MTKEEHRFREQTFWGILCWHSHIPMYNSLTLETFGVALVGIFSLLLTLLRAAGKKRLLASATRGGSGAHPDQLRLALRH